MLVDALTVPASLHDPDGRFVHMNAGAIRASGLSNAQTVGLDVTSLVPPEDREHVAAQFRRAVEQGEPTDFGTAFVDARGNERFTRAQQFPLMNDAGRVVGVLILAWQARWPSEVRNARPLAGQLTARQLEVLRLIASGRSTLEVARELQLAPPTVRNHVRDALAQLDAHTRVEAVAKAQHAGLLSPHPLEPG
jgi:PAS domain S-box-containing protein